MGLSDSEGSLKRSLKGIEKRSMEASGSKGSWDIANGVIVGVAILIATYNPIEVLITC